MAKENAKLKVEGMACEHCVMSIKRAVSTLNGVESVEVDLKAKQVTVVYDSAQVEIGVIKEAITEQGYDVK